MRLGPDQFPPHVNPFGKPAAPNGSGSPVRGQSATLARAPAVPTLDTRTWYPLARAEDARVMYWQVTLAPVTLLGVGSSVQGMPPTIKTGAPVLRMTWGGGGVTFRTEFEYPVAGSSFVVSGDNIALEARAVDAVSTFTDAELVSLGAWVAPTGQPTAREPLVVAMLDAPLVGPFPLAPFTRALLVTMSAAAATATVTFQTAFGNTVIHLPASDGVRRVPVPAGASLYTVSSSSGTVAVGLELAFT